MNRLKSFLISIFVFIFISLGAFRKSTVRLARRFYAKYSFKGGKLASYILNELEADAPWVQHVVSIAKSMSARRRYSYIRSTLKNMFIGTLARKNVQERLGFPFPGLFIISPSDQCNLNCAFCYSKETRYPAEMSKEQFDRIITHYKGYGTNYYLVTGGEPFMYPHLTEITDSHSSTVFFIYTNATLIDDRICAELVRKTNVIPMISTDISAALLDTIRGEGVYDKVLEAEKKLAAHRIVYGKSVVVNRRNFDFVKDPAVVQTLFNGTCLAVMFVRYAGTDPSFAITDDEYLELVAYTSALRATTRGIIFNFPNEEFNYFGGCVRGKYLIHIRSNGDVETCPFAHEKIGNIYEHGLPDLLTEMYENGFCLDCGNCSSKCVQSVKQKRGVA